MEKKRYHLAEINIAQTRAALDDPMMADFVSQLEAVNKLADESPGFIWRLKGEDGGAGTYIRAFDNERILINISLWESVEALHRFAYRHQHGAVYRDRGKWFESVDGPPLAMWWIPEDHIPTIDEGKARLETLKKDGPTPAAFT